MTTTTVTFDQNTMNNVQAELERRKAQDADEKQPKRVEEAPADVCAMVSEVIGEYFPRLAEVSIKTMLAFAATDVNGDLKGTAIKVHGVAAAGKVKITSQADRAAGMADVVITLDGDRWEEWSETEQRSRIWHELYHLEPTGKVDSGGRPKLKMRPHDVELGVFKEAMQVFGAEGMDTKIMAEACEDTREWVQPMLSWG